MKRASTGRSSISSNILKPRNIDFTPVNGQSSVSGGRKHGQKLVLGDSAKRTGRAGRISTERSLRSSLASSRFTPTRPNIPTININRMSTDSARNSGVGLSTKKDPRPLNDPTYKTQCINRIMEFLMQNGYPESFTRRTLLSPSTKDFTNIFQFIYRYLDKNYTLPPRFEEEIPKLLKNLSYPSQLNKSSFVSVGSPHTWPAVLAMLVYLIDIVTMSMVLGQDTHSSLEEEKPRHIITLISMFKDCNTDEDFNEYMDNYSREIKREDGVLDSDLEEVENELEAAEQCRDSVPDMSSQLKSLREDYAQSSDDLNKLATYCQELQGVIQNRSGLLQETERKLEELHAEESLICQEVEDLKRLEAQQKLSSADLIQLKNHSQEIGQEIEEQKKYGEELQSRIWNVEMEFPKVQSSLRSSFVDCETVLQQLDVGEELFASYEDINTNFEEIVHKVTSHKKAAKKAMTQAQNKNWEMDQELTSLNEKLLCKKTENKKLETKLRHVEEEYKVAQEEIAKEEQSLLDEIEFRHQQVMKVRRTDKAPIMQLQCELEEKKQELETYQKKKQLYMQEGIQFLKDVFQEALDATEQEDSILAQYNNNLITLCDDFQQWLDTTTATTDTDSTTQTTSDK